MTSSHPSIDSEMVGVGFDGSKSALGSVTLVSVGTCSPGQVDPMGEWGKC
jgi:hypothetical protein